MTKAGKSKKKAAKRRSLTPTVLGNENLFMPIRGVHYTINPKTGNYRMKPPR